MVRVEGWVVTPPLPQIMATFGTGVFTCVPMEEVKKAKFGTSREAHCNTILSPTCNACVTGGVHSTETWECLINNLALPDDSNSLSEHAQHIVDHPKTLGSVDDLLGFMARAKKYAKGSLFERLFTAIAGRARMEWGVVIKRRLVVKLPTYEKNFHQKISTSLRSAALGASLPGLGSWLASSITVVSARAQKVSSLPVKVKGLKVHVKVQVVLQHTPSSTCTPSVDHPNYKVVILDSPICKTEEKEELCQTFGVHIEGKMPLCRTL